MQQVKTFHVLTSGVVLISAGILLASLLISPTRAADTNANVNIGNDNPTINVIDRDSSIDGAWTPGQTLTPAANTNNVLTVNVDVTDTNGFDNQTITVTSVANRTTGSGTSSDYTCTGHDHTCVPRTGPVTCGALDAGTQTRRFQCIVPVKYSSDPTAAGTQISPGVNVEGERWDMIIRANDTVVNVDDKTSFFEYNELVAWFTNDTLLDLGTTATDGTETPDDSLTAAAITTRNSGNTEIDFRAQADKATDAAAWTCTGAGNPLISDLHLAGNNVGVNYATMFPTTNNGDFVNLNVSHPRDPDNAFGSKDIGARFATTQTITPGTCTLSSLVVTAIRSE